jgi:hypothetical protein
MMPVSECDEVEKDPAIMQLPPHDFELRTQGEAAAFSGRNSPPLRFLSDDHLSFVGRKCHGHLFLREVGREVCKYFSFYAFTTVGGRLAE